uniref:Uncharacterized protein n=1 Tax=Rhizophora mucronata TaxID=61149 RepID=A0A2P2PBE9_RHIMU
MVTVTFILRRKSLVDTILTPSMVLEYPGQKYLVDVYIQSRYLMHFVWW